MVASSSSTFKGCFVSSSAEAGAPGAAIVVTRLCYQCCCSATHHGSICQGCIRPGRTSDTGYRFSASTNRSSDNSSKIEHDLLPIISEEEEEILTKLVPKVW